MQFLIFRSAYGHGYRAWLQTPLIPFQVYLVDPREKRPCLKELNDIFKEQLVLQQAALKQVGIIEKVGGGLQTP